jgi:GMP synthase (glutamine-hydrolysing)
MPRIGALAMAMKKRVLILQAGNTEPAVAAKLGDYPEWFRQVLAPHAELTVAKTMEGELPATDDYDGVLMTGSPQSVTDGKPWMEIAAAYLLQASETKPVLGVCFGHQLLGKALGGKVEKNPLGREVGTTEVRLTAAALADPLFADLPERILVQQTHEDHVTAIPPGATLYADNAHCPVQAFGYGDRIRCVQFHPEMQAIHSTSLAEARRSRLDAIIPGGAEAVLRSIRPSPQSTAILVNWITRVVGA